MQTIREITLGQFYPGKSFVHRLDPRTKLSFVAAALIALFAKAAVVNLFIWSLAFVAGLSVAQVPGRLILNNVRPFKWLLVLALLLHMIWGPKTGKLLYYTPQVALYSDQLRLAVMSFSRLVLFIAYSSLLTLTTSPLDLSDALSKLLKPLRRFGFPVQEFAFMISIAMRFIPTILLEADRLRKAQISRGANFSGSLLQKLRALIPLTLPLFLGAFQRAEDLAIAMEARCYDPGSTRTSYKRLLLVRSDFAVLGLGMILLLFPVLLSILRV